MSDTSEKWSEPSPLNEGVSLEHESIAADGDRRDAVANKIIILEHELFQVEACPQTITGTPVDDPEADFEWESSNPEIAEVFLHDSGARWRATVIGKAPGSSRIVCTMKNGVMGLLDVVVRPGAIVALSIRPIIKK